MTVRASTRPRIMPCSLALSSPRRSRCRRGRDARRCQRRRSCRKRRARAGPSRGAPRRSSHRPLQHRIAGAALHRPAACVPARPGTAGSRYCGSDRSVLPPGALSNRWRNSGRLLGFWRRKSLHVSHTCFSLSCLALWIISRSSARQDPCQIIKGPS